MLSSAFILLAGAALATASPLAPLLGAREYVSCGTTQDADLAACQSILDNWSGQLDQSHRCTYGARNSAWNVASVPGCSVYVTDADNKEPDAIKETVQILMGCADTSKGKVNGLTTLADGTGVCIGGNDGCGDCFDDADFQPPRRRSVEPIFSNSTIEKRQFADIAGSVAELLDAILGQGGSDNTKRANGVRNVVDGMAKKYSPINVVACHTDHEAKFDGRARTGCTSTSRSILRSVGLSGTSSISATLVPSSVTATVVISTGAGMLRWRSPPRTTVLS